MYMYYVLCIMSLTCDMYIHIHNFFFWIFFSLRIAIPVVFMIWKTPKTKKKLSVAGDPGRVDEGGAEAAGGEVRPGGGEEESPRLPQLLKHQENKLGQGP